MNKGKLVIYIAGLLIVVNVSLWGFKFLKTHGKKHYKPRDPKELIIKKLDFNEPQVKEYEVLIKGHRKDVEAIEWQIKEAKKDLYNSIINTEISRDSILNEIGKKQIEIEKVHLAHFKEIKKLCNENQFPAFEKLIQEMGAVFSGPKHKRRKKMN